MEFNKLLNKFAHALQLGITNQKKTKRKIKAINCDSSSEWLEKMIIMIL